MKEYAIHVTIERADGTSQLAMTRIATSSALALSKALKDINAEEEITTEELSAKVIPM